jgi:adenine-specific DNA-methyltransferase
VILLSAQPGKRLTRFERTPDRGERTHSRFFDEARSRLERWAEDVKEGLEQEIKELDTQLREVKKQAKLQPSLEAKLSLHRKAKDLEAERSRKRRSLYESQDEIDRKKEALLSHVEARLAQRVETEPLFVIRWRVE